jgi:hypothetical protein
MEGFTWRDIEGTYLSITMKSVLQAVNRGGVSSRIIGS